jgi:hypothetical protein
MIPKANDSLLCGHQVPQHYGRITLKKKGNIGSHFQLAENSALQVYSRGAMVNKKEGYLSVSGSSLLEVSKTQAANDWMVQSNNALTH